MGKALIIAEKPSVASDISKALGKFEKHDDYFENDDYVISSAVGHLLTIVPPEGVEAGPNEDPEDENVALDEDDSLPWPDQGKLQRWWHARAAGLPAGRRIFMGAVPSPEVMARVLREGFQRQRIVAAQWHCLLAPGSRLFATAAPAWRQQRRVAAAPVTAAA